MKSSSAYGIHNHLMISENSTRDDCDHYQYETLSYEDMNPEIEDTVIYDEPFQ